MMLLRLARLLALMLTYWPGGNGFSPSSVRRSVQETKQAGLCIHNKACSEAGGAHDSKKQRIAQLTGYVSEQHRQAYEAALLDSGFSVPGVDEIYNEDDCVYSYKFVPACGMLQLVQSPPSSENDLSPPKWIPIVKARENVLVSNGWSFLDVDESETMSAFDVDAANLEGLYKPKWSSRRVAGDEFSCISELGFSIRQMTSNQVINEADLLHNDLSRSVLLDGKTDPPRQKITWNGYDCNGAVTGVPKGIFACAIGGLPLFSTSDLVLSSASSGWLSFAKPLASDHVCHIKAERGSCDQRTEVVCAKSGCHLGHYFGSDGYCINASCLSFLPAADKSASEERSLLTGAISYRSMEQSSSWNSPAIHLLKQTLATHVRRETLILGAGCFWHVEFALRRLPGVISTATGYAGGSLPQPTYEQVCKGESGHAEVVKVDFDPDILHRRILLDCFLAMHDPTKVRAHGKHAAGTGQYRSCIFLSPSAQSVLQATVRDAVNACREKLAKDLSTEVRVLENAPFFFPAEDRHQRHDELAKQGGYSVDELSTLPPIEWLSLYGRRLDSVVGSATTMDEAIAETRFMI